MMRQLPCLCYTTSSHGFKGADQRGEHSMAPAPPLTQNSCPGKTPCEGTTATPGRFGVILQKPQGFHIPTPHSQHRTTPGCSSRHNRGKFRAESPGTALTAHLPHIRGTSFPGHCQEGGTRINCGRKLEITIQKAANIWKSNALLYNSALISCLK